MPTLLDGRQIKNASIPNSKLESPGGGLSIIEEEIDFWSGKPIKTKNFTIANASVVPTSRVLVFQSGNTATGRLWNDYEWDSIGFSAKAGTGYFILSCLASWKIKWKRKIFYTFT